MTPPDKQVTVREFALLLNEGTESSIDRFSISASAFDWLLVNGLSSCDSNRELVRVKRQGNTVALQVVNFVGVLETPCGTRIEILPKISNEQVSIKRAQKTLLKMLAVVEKLNLVEFHNASLQTVNQPLFEILITQFLQATSKLIKRGLRNEYQRVEREQPYLKGQLLVSKQLRQRPGRQHYFHLSHDIFSANRAENRLLHSALAQVLKWAKSSDNQRLARELLFVFHDIDKSTNYKDDFRKWSSDRSLVHYQPLKAWCELILNQNSPFIMSGKHSGISFLFPMEVLFEKYVAAKLKTQLGNQFKVTSQTQNRYLVKHQINDQDEHWFKLRPDIVIYHGDTIVSVMDTKWKRINQNLSNSTDKYNITQSDMYQLQAYGEKYLNGKGELYLIYPKHELFNAPLQSFEFKPGLILKAVPYDLETDEFNIKLNITCELSRSTKI